MRLTLYVALCAAPLFAQDAAARAARIRASMQASLTRQRASVARQLRPIRIAPPPAAECPQVPLSELSTMIDAAAQEHGVTPELVREVARQESAFRPCAVSPKGAQGLMQLMPATQVTLQVKNPFDPRESLAAGARLLKQLLDRYDGNLALALSAYNAGPARVDATLSVPQIPETQNYVSNVLERLAGR